MLVDGVALLRIDLARVLVRESVQRLLDGDADCGPCALLLAPIKYELLALEDGENLLSDPLDLRLFVCGEVGCRPREQIEDRELLFGQAGGDRARLLLGERAAELDQLVEVLLDVETPRVVLIEEALKALVEVDPR